jgi:hypothetical protein
VQIPLVQLIRLSSASYQQLVPPQSIEEVLQQASTLSQPLYWPALSHSVPAPSGESEQLPVAEHVPSAQQVG